VTALPRWLGPSQRPLMGWLSLPESGATASGVLVLPPVGYQYWSAHRTWRTIAERLAEAGHTVLRLDYDGTGDSAGDGWDDDRVPAWRGSARHGVEELRALGCERVAVVGIRLGATLALLEDTGADQVIGWAPVTAGRRYAKEIRMLSTPVPDSETVVSAGFVFRPETIADIGAMKVDAPDPVAGGDSALEEPAEYAIVPEDVVEAIVARVGPAEAPRIEAPAPRPTAAMDWRGAAIEEEVVTLGPEGLIGILSRPPQPDASRPTVVFLNTGSEPHVGSGRTWVEYARTLAGEGYQCLRVDWSGWGESPDHGHAPGRPYDPHCEDETISIVRALRERGHENVFMVGLCASAWVALRAVLRQPVAGVIALNPQLYWKPGDPVEALMSETRQRRAPEREREQRGCRWGLWSALDVAGQRPWAGRWLDDLDASGVPVLMVFAEGDDGIEYLNNRLARRLDHVKRDGLIRTTEVPDIDHSMHRAWLRDRIVAVVRGELERLAAASPQQEMARA
jgi:pimeloyl-ACP methyl ester carboxylesterase